MPTTRLHVITETSSHSEKAILKGVFGTVRDDGCFVPAVCLSDRIYLLRLMTQAPPAGLSVHALEIEEEHLPALQATIASALGRRWAQAYDRVAHLSNLVLAEAQQVRGGIADVVAEMAVPGYQVEMSKEFGPLRGTYIDPSELDEHEDEFSEEITTQPCYVLSVNQALKSTAAQAWTAGSATPLVMVAQEPQPATAGQPTRSDSVDENYASGRLMSLATVYGSTPQARGAVLAALATLPHDLSEEIISASSPVFADIQWQRPEDAQADVRQRIRSGEAVTAQALSILAPHSSERDRMLWAEGFLANQALAQPDPADHEGVEQQAPAPRM